MEFSKASLDRYITGNYGEDQQRYDDNEPDFPMAPQTSKCLTCGEDVELIEGMWFTRGKNHFRFCYGFGNEHDPA